MGFYTKMLDLRVCQFVLIPNFYCAPFLRYHCCCLLAFCIDSIMRVGGGGGGGMLNTSLDGIV